MHEAAHGIVLRKLGFKIVEAGLGVPVPPQLRFQLPRVPFRLAISPWLVVAYVMPDPADKQRLDAMPYRDKAWWLNAGIVANLLLGGVFATAAALVAGSLVKAAIAAAITALVWFTRRQLAAYIIPAAAVPVLAWLIYLMAGHDYSMNDTGFGFASLANGMPGITTLTEVLAFFVAVNVGLALINTLPILGDNGKVIKEILHRWAGRRAANIYEVTAAVLLVAALGAAFVSDMWAIGAAVIR